MLAKEGIGKLLFKFSLPAGIGMFVMTLYNIVDTIFIGHKVGYLGIAGLTIAFPLQMMILGTGLVIGIGGASLISRSLGADNIDKAELTLGNAACLVIIISLVVTATGVMASGPLVMLIGSSETIFPYANGYVKIILLGTIFQMFAIAIGNTVRAEGNMLVPMISMILGASINIVLDALFILGMEMGVQGAALATILSALFSSIYLVIYYMSQKSSLKFRLKNLILDMEISKEICSVGISDFARSAAMSIVTMFLNRMLVLHGGDILVAVFGIMGRVMMFFMMPLISIGQGLQPILGFSYGAKQYGRSIKAIRLAITSSSIISVGFFVIIFLFPSPIMGIFTNDENLITEASRAARIIFIALPLVGYQVIGSVVFQAMGKAMPAFLAASSRQILFLLPLIIILPRFFEVAGIYISFPVADLFSFILTLILMTPQMNELRRNEVLIDNPGKES
ncbi:MAG: MATE family efflux transporter [Deltaproteobacteria bacterium]|nr:MATE family efflux transporter [Deltaproteobacteria bacterium]